MQTTLDKTITVLEKLLPKYTNLSTKLNEAILSDEENSNINIQLDNILALFNEDSSGDSKPDTIIDLVTLGILPKPISEYTNADIGSIISIPYIDETGIISGPIEFEVVGVNHHKDINDETKPTITLMTKNAIRYAAFDAKEPDNPMYDPMFSMNARASGGNNRWSVSNIRQWLNSEGAANEWFTPQHEYDTAPDKTNVGFYEEGAYADNAGFLAGFSTEIKQHLAIVRNKTILCEEDRSILSKDFEETEDKVFLPSYTEMGYGILRNCSEGSQLAKKFTDNESRIKYNFFWMRTPNPDRTETLYFVDAMGIDDWNSAFNGTIFIAPLIVLC